jgi:Bardet-Biedl syndrome 7 protein
MLRRHTIKPLSLHQRSSTPIDPNKFEEDFVVFFNKKKIISICFRRMNTMKITGSFSYAEIHSWIQFCLADVPERPPIDKENRLTYTNIFLQTQLECIYRFIEF